MTDLHEAAAILEANVDKLGDRDKDFAHSLLSQFKKNGKLSEKQGYWVSKLAERSTQPKSEPKTQEVGSFAGVVNLFKVSKVKWPKIRLQLKDGSPLVLSVAGSQSKAPGTVNVTDGGPFGANVWYGRVKPTGEWEMSKKADQKGEEIGMLLAKLAADPARVAAQYGKLTGQCAFCKSGLTTEESTSVGYGPVCADRWGLPWGKTAKNDDPQGRNFQKELAF